VLLAIDPITHLLTYGPQHDSVEYYREEDHHEQDSVRHRLFMTLDVQNLSRMKYHMELAIGSTMASVIATDSGTFAISIRQVIAIRK